MSENLSTIILPAKTGVVDPTTVTPDFIGQTYVNTATNTTFYAKSLTIGDYEEIIDITSTVSIDSHVQNTDTKLDNGQVNEVTSLDIRTHLDNLTKHRLINDGISTTTNLYSASQIDALIVASTSNLDIKNSVVTISDTNITLSGEQTINGVLTSASRVGVVGQTLSEENGIYDTSSGAWTRATDADVDSEVTNGLSFFVSNSGSTKNGNQYILITADPITLGTTALTFIEVPRIVLGTTSGTATEGNDPRIPTQDENDALVGTDGTPSNINKYVTDSDTRLHDQNTDTDLDPTFEATFVKKVDSINVLSDITSPGADIEDAVTKKHTQNTDTILTNDGATALLNAGVLKANLLSDDAINIQIDEIRARDIDGLKLNDDGGNGIFIQDGGNVGIGTPSPAQLLDVDGIIRSKDHRLIAGKKLILDDTAFGNAHISTSSAGSKNILFTTDGSEVMRIDSLGNVGIGVPFSPDATAKLQIDSTTQGVLPPRLTTVQRDAITSPATGLEIYNTSRKHPEFFNSNTWRGTEEGALNVVHFTDASDLPAPVAGVITLEENTTYVMYNDDPTASQKQVIFTDRLQIPDAGGVRITSTGVATALLVYTGTGTFITTNDTFTGFLTIDTLFISAPNGTLFDIDGVLPVGSEFFPRLFLVNTGTFDTNILGTIKTISVNFNIGAFFSCKQGLIVDGVHELLIGDWRFADWLNDTGAIMLTSKNTLRFPKIQNCTFETSSNETAFNIEPNIGNQTYIMSGNSYRGAGILYHTGISGVIASIADASTSGSVTAVSGTSFGESIFTDVAHGLVEGEVITTSGFSDSNYNGIFEILEIIDSDNFRIHALFTATGTGSWDSAKITVSDVAHGLVVDDGVQLVTDDFTLGYNTGYRVLANTADTFVVNATFTSTDTGTWNSDSLTGTDPRLRIIANAGIPDSAVFARMTMLTNATETVISTISTPVKVAGTWTELESERFSFSNGRWTYTGFESVQVIVDIQFRVDVVSGNARTINMYIAKNGTIDINTQSAFLVDSGTPMQGSVTGLLSLNTNDFIELFGENDTTDDNIIIDSAKFITRE